MIKRMFFVTLVLIGVIAFSTAQGQSHRVSCGSQGNRIEMGVENGSGSTVSVVKVLVNSKPDWVQMTTLERVLIDLLSGKEATASFEFSINKSVAIGTEGAVTFNVSAEGQQWTKTVAISVVAPERYELLQNFPNPFNPSTKIEYTLPKQTMVKLVVYNVAGQEVQTLLDQEQDAGYKSVVFDASNLPSGVYFYKLQAGGFVDIKKMMLLK